MLTVRLTRKVGVYRKGQVVTFDDRSAAALLADGRAEQVEQPALFDPGAHTAKEAVAYLRAAADRGDTAEVSRVLGAERAGKARRTVLGT